MGPTCCVYGHAGLRSFRPLARLSERDMTSLASIRSRRGLPVGGLDERKSPVHAFAEDAALPVFTPRTLRRNRFSRRIRGADSRCCSGGGIRPHFAENRCSMRRR